MRRRRRGKIKSTKETKKKDIPIRNLTYQVLDMLCIKIVRIKRMGKRIVMIMKLLVQDLLGSKVLTIILRHE